MRIEKCENVTLLLVTDDMINFRKGNCTRPRFAYYDKQLLKNYGLLENAIKNNTKLNLIIERISKGKSVDYVTHVSAIISK